MRLSTTFRKAGAIFVMGSETRLRLLAILLATIFWLGVLVPTAGAISAAEIDKRRNEAVQKALDQATNSRIKPPEGEASTKPDNFDYAGALPTTQSKNKPAADYGRTTDAAAPGLGGLPPKDSSTVQGVGLQPASGTSKPTHKEEEIVSKRTADSTTFRNKDGSYTTKKYYAPKFFKKEGKWQDIDTTLIEDKNAGDSGNIFGRALGTVQSWAKEETTFTVKENDWQGRFAPSDSAEGMVRVKFGDSQIGFSPVGANKVNPVITTASNGDQTVHYYNLWPGVDVEYAVLSSQLKENIVLKNRDAQADFSFKILGGTLKKTKADQGGNYGYDIVGALNNEFAIAPLAISLNKYGFEARQPLTHNVSDGRLNISVDRTYLRELPKDAYPVLIDPTYVRQQQFGTRAGGNYGSFKSDGYFCPSNICNPLAGSVLDSQGVWRTWRGIIYSDYHEVRGKQLNNARLRLTQRLGLSTSGTTAVKNFTAWHATGFCHSCLGVASGTVSIGTVGDIDVTSIYQSRMNANDYDAWLMITGEETTSTTYKNWDPDSSYVEFTFIDVIPTPTITSPTSEGQIYIDPQVSFSSTAHTNPASGVPLQYVFCVSTSPGCGGAVMTSTPQASPLWTIPDGVLQDGTTYYVQAQSHDPTPNINVYSAWGVPKSFKIDSRTGKDATQAYDTLGPVSVDLATGNTTTSASSHSSSALGGSMGVSLDYNSPVRSRNGLVGEYWNVPANYSGGVPTSTPNMTRVDQTIDFGWDHGSPASGVINNDWFYARWTGYFVAPETGTFYFGSRMDDVISIFVNNTQVNLTNPAGGPCYTVVCYGNGVTLQKGQVVPFLALYQEATSPAYTHLWVKGAVPEQIAPASWFQTGVREAGQRYGLTGRYYKDNGTHDFADSANTMIMQRNDPVVSFAWGAGAAVAGGPQDNFMARWTGHFTAPVAGTYEFGTRADDGTRITVNGNQVMQNWNAGAFEKLYGSGVTLTAGQSVPITVDYFEVNAGAYMSLLVKGAVPEQVVPAEWLSYSARILPAGWNLGIDPDGNVSYDHLKVNPDSVLLTDSTGSTHEYKWDAGKKSYIPPVNEDGQLTRNNDATYTFQDVDGRTYEFNSDGTVKSVTNPVDDTRPAALQYTYGGTPTRLTQITDGVTSDRWAKVYYSGDSNCTSAPATFDSAAPANMLCAVKTNDGRTTSFFYKSGKLARIAEPGNELTDFGYDNMGRITSVRDVLANDAIGAGVRNDDATANTEIAYDNIGRVNSVTQPAATAGGNRMQHTLAYYAGNGTYFGATEQHIVGAPEPNGFTRRIEYDKLLRTIKDTDIANLSDHTEWHADKDLVFSTTDETGLKSTTIYDDQDRAVNQYGPAPAAWYDATTREPLTAYAGQVPRTDTAYDEGMQGPNVTYYSYSSNSKSLTGAPKLHSTNLVGASTAQFSKLYTSSPVPNVANDWGFRATGRIRLPATGTYNFRLYSDGGVRLYIDDKLELDDWNDGTARSHPDIAFTNTAGSVHKIRVEYYHRTGDANFQLNITPPGGSETADVNQYISPDFSLTTSTKTYDSTTGNGQVVTNYGNNPELGLPQSVTVDPSGLNLATSNTYEPQGASGSYLRQTTKNLPGNPTNNPSFSYSYYGATETRDNPCTTGTTEAYKQGGFMKFKTEADPDGAGGQTSRVTEIVYDDTGATIATRYNTDDWTCNTYDSRGRVTQTIVPAYNGEDARDIQNDYAVGGNPLVTTSWDADGWIVVWSDLLGRTTKYRDVFDDETTTTYDNFGRMTQRVSPMGTEVYVYDNFNRLTEQRLDGVTYARVTYDQYGRIDNVEYPNSAGQKLTLGRDTLGRQNSQTYYQGGSSVAGGNILPNSSVEQPYPNTPSEPEGWHSSAWGTNTTTFSYLNEGHAGGRSVKTEVTSHTNGDGKWYFDAVPVSANTSYTFRDYYKSNVTTEVVLQYTLQDTSFSYVSLGFPAASSTWAQNNYTFTTPANATHVTVFHVVKSVGWLIMDDAELYLTSQAPSAPTVLASDTVNRTQSGQIVNDIVAAGGNELWYTYGYDGADRLTSANIGPHSYSYGFGTQNTTACGTGNNMNPNAGKNSNRTSQTINGTTTYFCYDYADRLISSSNPLYSGVTYDSHGNIKSIGTGATPLNFYYDSSDRSSGYEQFTSAGDGLGLYYSRDVQGRITGRYKCNIVTWSWQCNVNNLYYHYTAAGDTPDYVRNSSWTIIEKNLQLPGGVLLTIKPTEAQANNQKQYSLPNIHGDTLLTTNAAGVNTSNGNGPANSFTYDPFGNVLPGSILPANTADASYGWVGQHQKLNETQFTLAPVQMGKRIYLPGVGRFIQVDPIEGGVDNNYVYPTDPVNEYDLTGEAAFLVPLAIIVGRVALQQTVKYATKKSMQEASKRAAQEAAKRAAKKRAEAAAKAALQQAIKKVEYNALKTVRQNPRIGHEIMQNKINDPLYRHAAGWRKMEYTLRENGHQATIHYFYNVKTRVISQLKVKHSK